MKRASVKPCKFILCCVKQCKYKNKFIYIVLYSIKQCNMKCVSVKPCKFILCCVK
jgi:hypothetical protein